MVLYPQLAKDLIPKYKKLAFLCQHTADNIFPLSKSVSLSINSISKDGTNGLDGLCKLISPLLQNFSSSGGDNFVVAVFEFGIDVCCFQMGDSTITDFNLTNSTYNSRSSLSGGTNELGVALV